MSKTIAPKTIADFTAGLVTAKESPTDELATLEAFQGDCERRVAQPIGKDAAAHIRARLELSEVKQALGEFYTWRLEARQNAAAEKYLQTAAPEICETLRAMIAERSKAQPDFIAGKLKQAAEITQRLFSKTDRHEIYKEREAAEEAAADAELVIATATAAVRSFEISPDEQTFHAACARTNEINFPLVPGH